MIVRELLTKFGIEADEKAIKRWDTQVASVKNTLLAGVAAATAFGGALYKLVTSAVEVADEIGTTAENIQLSTKALQEWRYAADQADVGAEELTTGLGYFTRSLGNAKKGSQEHIKTLAQLGISYHDLNTLKPEQLIDRVADGMARLKTQDERAAAAQTLFGRGSLNMARFLGSGSAAINVMRQRAQALGLVLSDEVIANADKADLTFKDFRWTLAALKNEIGGGLIPQATDIVTHMIAWVQVNREWLRLNIDAGIKRFTGAVSGAVEWVQSVYPEVTKWIEELGGLDKILKTLIITIVAFKATSLGVAIVSGVWTAITAAVAAYRAAVVSAGVTTAAMTALATGGLSLIPIAIAGAVAAVYYYWDKISAVIDRIKAKVNSILHPFKSFESAGTPTWLKEGPEPWQKTFPTPGRDVFRPNATRQEQERTREAERMVPPRQRLRDLLGGAGDSSLFDGFRQPAFAGNVPASFAVPVVERPAKGGDRVTSVDARTTMHVTLPPGTPESHTAILMQEFNRMADARDLRTARYLQAAAGDSE